MMQMLAPLFHLPPSFLTFFDWRQYQEVVGRRLGFVLTTGSHYFSNHTVASGYTTQGPFKKGIVELQIVNSPFTNMTDENVLVYIMERLVEGLPRDSSVRQAVNIGAGVGEGTPGLSGSDSVDPMFPLFTRMNFSGLASEPLTTNHLSKSLPSHVRLVSEPTTPVNVLRQMHEAQISQRFGALKIDIDSFDCDVLDVIIQQGYQPLVIMMELNGQIPPPLKFARTFVNRRELWECNSQMNRDAYSLQMAHPFRSCSLSFANELLATRGYILLGVRGIDGLWAHESVFQSHLADT